MAGTLNPNFLTSLCIFNRDTEELTFPIPIIASGLDFRLAISFKIPSLPRYFAPKMFPLSRESV